MKKGTIIRLQIVGKSNLFTEHRFKQVKEVLKIATTKDPVLKSYLSIDPLNKARWCADHLILFVEGGYLK